MLKPFDADLDKPQIWYNEPDLAETDDPYNIRWRAFWDRNYSTDMPDGIKMCAYPVVRKTQKAAWINTSPLRQLKRWHEDEKVYEWNNDFQALKQVYDSSRSAWAKPTRAGALRSLGFRLTRWSEKTRRDVERVNAACDVAAALLSAPTVVDGPGHAIFWDNHPASGHKIALADENTPLAVALRRLKWQYERGDIEKCAHIEAVLKEFAG